MRIPHGELKCPKSFFALLKKRFAPCGMMRLAGSNRSLLAVAFTTSLLACIASVVFYINLFGPLPESPMLVATEVYDINNRLAATFFIQHRRPVGLDEIPQFLQQAFLAVEDHRFYEHQGINPGRVLKAALVNLRRGGIEQGGSTITQQLAKNIFLTHERSFTRKIKELYYTVKLELNLSKPEIFERYLNQVYFGHGAYGIKVAAKTYFQKDLKDLNEAEMALLAGLPRGPSFYSPYKNPDTARHRMRLTLHRMLECDFITKDQHDAYVQQSFTLPGLEPHNSAPYFMDRVQREINQLFPDKPDLIYTGGIRIESTMDLRIQEAANQAFTKGLPHLLVDSRGIPQPQGSLIALDPKNGEIRALIGGTDYGKSPFNRATQAKRQPGSSFKPILYAKALESHYTLASSFDLTPKTYMVQGKPYCPTDHGDKEATGRITLRDALASSSNVVAVQLIEEIGPRVIAEFAKEFGIASPLVPSLSLALGTSEVSPLEMAAAYMPLSNGGAYFEPTIIRRVIDRNGRVLYERKPPEGRRVLDPKVAFLVTDALTGVLKPGGTAANIGHRISHPAAGKTGTTEKNRDAWFIGYTPDLLAAVFIGCDNFEKNLPGAANRVAAPIWADFMTAALKGYPKTRFKAPFQLFSTTICQATGRMPNPFCPIRHEYFIKGTEPTETCSEHRITQVNLCSISGDLPGPFCYSLTPRILSPLETPENICTICGRGKKKAEPKSADQQEKSQTDSNVKHPEDKDESGFFRRIFGKKKKD